MEMERVRAARMAALEPPVPDIAQNLEAIQKHRYKQKNIDEYSTTYYHIPRERVERADTNLHQVSNHDQWDAYNHFSKLYVLNVTNLLEA